MNIFCRNWNFVEDLSFVFYLTFFILILYCSVNWESVCLICKKKMVQFSTNRLNPIHINVQRFSFPSQTKKLHYSITRNWLSIFVDIRTPALNARKPATVVIWKKLETKLKKNIMKTLFYILCKMYVIQSWTEQIFYFYVSDERKLFEN